MTSSSEEDSTGIVVKEEDFEDISLWKPSIGTSAFSPYRPVTGTVLTNLQRGNIETKQIHQFPPGELSFHSRAAMGEINLNDFTPDLNVDEKDSNSLTALMWACFYGQLPSARLLLQNHAKVDIEGENGETALLLAAAGGHHEVCRLLLNYGADPNHMDHLENTALMYAVFDDSAHCVSELLEGNAEITMTNSDGATAFSLAVNRGSKKAQVVMERYILKLLEPS